MHLLVRITSQLTNLYLRDLRSQKRVQAQTHLQAQAQVQALAQAPADLANV